MNIVIVDDERDVQALFEQRFRREVREGLLHLHFAFSGEEALALLAHRGIADIVLILSDINMPTRLCDFSTESCGQCSRTETVSW